MKEKYVQFVQDTDNEASDDDDHVEAQFGFLNVGGRNELYLRNMLLLDNKYTVDLFCNKRLVIRFWKTDESMTVKGNVGTIKTNYKAYVKGYCEI